MHTTVNWYDLMYHFCFHFHVIMEPGYCLEESLSLSILVQHVAEEVLFEKYVKKKERFHSIL